MTARHAISPDLVNGYSGGTAAAGLPRLAQLTDAILGCPHRWRRVETPRGQVIETCRCGSLVVWEAV